MPWNQSSGGGASNVVAGAGLAEVLAPPLKTIEVVAADGSITVYANAVAVGVINDAQHGNRGGGSLHALATLSAAGFMSAADKAAVAIALPGAPFLFGNTSVSGTNVTRYLSPGNIDSLAPTTPVQFRVPRAGVLRNLRVRHNTPDGNGLAIVYTVRVNGVDTALSVSIASTTLDGSNLVSTAAVAAGDLIDIKISKAASIGASPLDVIATFEETSA